MHHQIRPILMKSNNLTLIAIRHISKHPVQSFLLILGIALGVAMIVAIDVANTSASQAFALSTDSIAGKATHQIVAAPGDLPSELYVQLRGELGLREVAPVVTGLVLLPDADDLPIQLLGVDPFAEGPFRNYLGDGDGGLSFDALTQLLIQPDTVLMPTAIADENDFSAGQDLTLLAEGQEKTVRIVGLLAPSDDFSQRALSGLVLADISTAQEVLGKTGRLSHIDLILPEDSAAAAPIEAQIREILPANAQLQRAEVRNETVTQMTQAFELNLSALSFLALIVGMFLIYNTISFSVVQRRPVLGTLRCLGVTRREIFALVLTEAFVLSALGAAIGLGFGVLLGRGLVALVTQTINDVFFTTTVQSFSVAPFTLYKGFIAGLAAGLIAATFPAIEATSVPPSGALKRSVGEDRMQRLIPALTALGIGLMLAGGALLIYVSAYLWVNFLSVTLILLGAACITPLITRLLMSLLTPLTAKLLGIIGVMAPRDIVRSLSRTSVTIAALMLAVTVIIGVSVMVDSFRNTVVIWLNDILTADVYVSPVGQAERVEAYLDPEFIAEMEQLEGVMAIGLQQATQVFAEGIGEVELRAYNAQPGREERPFLWLDGSLDEMLTAFDEGAVMVSEIFARRTGLPLNEASTLTLITPDGPREFPVRGVFYDYALPEVGYVAMSLPIYQQYWHDDRVTNLGLYLEPQLAEQADDITERLRAEYAGAYALSFASNRGIKVGALEVFDRTFTITAALRLLATVVAFIGVLSALMSLQLERTRELGTLRANGMSIGQLWSKTFLETGLMGLTAGLLSIPVGMLLAIILIYVINLRSFGWTLQLYLTPSIFLTALLVAIVAALLAAIYPVWRLNRMQLALAIREE